jgi:hypothetical protein
LTQNPCCFNFSKAARGTVGTVYAFQEHVEEEPLLFLSRNVTEDEFKGKTEELVMEQKNKCCYVTKSVT